MYYDFLIKVRTAGCENVIVVGGNHDSPSFLNASKDILAALNVAVVGNATENIEDEIIIVEDKKGIRLLLFVEFRFYEKGTLAVLRKAKIILTAQNA